MIYDAIQMYIMMMTMMMMIIIIITITITIIRGQFSRGGDKEGKSGREEGERRGKEGGR